VRANRYVANEPRPSVSETVDIAPPKFAKHCEVPGCATLYVGKDSDQRDRFACGKADVLVLDHRGNKRGICATHYTRELVRQGKASNQDIVDADGRYDAAKIEHLHASHAQADIELLPAYHGAPKGPMPFQIPPVVQRAIEHSSDDDLSDDEFFATHQRDRGMP
jgi:hypothetical protein